MTKKLGVIGGMGAEATSYYFQQLVAHTQAEKDQDHIDTIILNHASLPDRTKSILKGNTEKLLNKLTKDAQLLEQLGVETSQYLAILRIIYSMKSASKFLYLLFIWFVKRYCMHLKNIKT